MDGLNIRRAEERDIPALDKLLYQVCKVHSDIRPDLFQEGAKKYTDEELQRILPNDLRPVFVAERDGVVQGYAFCIHQKHSAGSMTNIKTLYIDDLCVDQEARGAHVGQALYQHVLAYAREQGCYNVTLNVWAGNDGAEGFYRRMGLSTQKTGLEQIL